MEYDSCNFFQLKLDVNELQSASRLTDHQSLVVERPRICMHKNQ